MGDVGKRREGDKIGPFKYWENTGRRDEADNLIMEDIEDPENPGQFKKVPQRESEPFLKELWFRKNHVTEKMQAKERAAYELYGPDAKEPNTLRLGKYRLSVVLVAWDMTLDGKPIPATFEAMISEEYSEFFDGDLIYGLIARYFEVTRPPKESSEKSQNTSSAEE